MEFLDIEIPEQKKVLQILFNEATKFNNLYSISVEKAKKFDENNVTEITNDDLLEFSSTDKGCQIALALVNANFALQNLWLEILRETCQRKLPGISSELLKMEFLPDENAVFLVSLNAEESDQMWNQLVTRAQLLPESEEFPSETLEKLKSLVFREPEEKAFLKWINKMTLVIKAPVETGSADNSGSGKNGKSELLPNPLGDGENGIFPPVSGPAETPEIPPKPKSKSRFLYGIPPPLAEYVRNTGKVPHSVAMLVNSSTMQAEAKILHSKREEDEIKEQYGVFSLSNLIVEP